MSSVSEFFNEKYGSNVSSMTDGQMKDLLKDLIDTDHWIAILKYNQSRKIMTQNALYTIDPIKDPTLMARTQGTLTGLTDLEDAVYRLNTKSQNDAE